MLSSFFLESGKKAHNSEFATPPIEKRKYNLLFVDISFMSKSVNVLSDFKFRNNLLCPTYSIVFFLCVNISVILVTAKILLLLNKKYPWVSYAMVNEGTFSDCCCSSIRQSSRLEAVCNIIFLYTLKFSTEILKL